MASGVTVNVSSVESGLRGTAEGATVAAAAQGVGGSEGLGAAAAGIAEGLNPSVAGIASVGGATTTLQPLKDASSGTGADNPSTRPAKVTITIRQP